MLSHLSKKPNNGIKSLIDVTGSVSSSKKLFSTCKGYLQPNINPWRLLSIIFNPSGLFSSHFSVFNHGNQQSLFQYPTNFHQHKLSNLVCENETIFWNLCFLGCCDGRKILATISGKSYHCLEKILLEELPSNTRLLGVFLKHKTKRWKRKKKKICKFKNNQKNSASTTKANIEEEQFLNCSNYRKEGAFKFTFFIVVIFSLIKLLTLGWFGF